jgi:hypothetical protein
MTYHEKMKVFVHEPRSISFQNSAPDEGSDSFLSPGSSDGRRPGGHFELRKDQL